MSAPAPACKCGHALHVERCQQPVEYEYPEQPDRKHDFFACGCFRVNGVMPQEWRAYYGE